MKTARLLLTLLLALGTVTAATAGDDRHDRFSTELSGYNEVHFIAGPPAALRGAVSTPATGRFKARIDDRKDVILLRAELRGADGHGGPGPHPLRPATHDRRHRRLALPRGPCWRRRLCATATPPCPQEGTVKGSITAAQVLEAVGQGLAAGDFEALVAAIRSGAAYANVHSSTFGPGEIRGQIDHDNGHRH